MAGLKFLNALQQHSDHTCSLSSLSVESSGSLEDGICSLSHSSFNKASKYSHICSIPSFCVITKQRSMSCREAVLQGLKKNKLMKPGNHLKNYQ